MFAYSITDMMAEDLRVLDQLRARLDLRGTLPRRWGGRLRREFQASSIAASTSMEGVRVTVEDVRRLLVGDTPGDVTDEDADLVRGYRDAMAYVLKRADAREFEWSTELLLALQDSVLGHSWKRGAGRLREGGVTIRDGAGAVRFVPPDAEEVPALVRELACWGNDAADVPPAIVAAMLHLGVAAIHPFRDGNGRTARICAALAMYRGGYRAPEFTSLEEWWGAHLAEYYGSFESLGPSWDRRADATPFLQSHVAAQRAQAEALALRQRVERALWQVLEAIVEEDLSGPPRWVDALFDAFMWREVTNRYYRAVAGIEIAAASQDLSKMRTAGIITARGDGAARSYWGGDRLFRLVAARIGVAHKLEKGGEGDLARDEILGALTARLRDEDEFIAREVAARYGSA